MPGRSTFTRAPHPAKLPRHRHPETAAVDPPIRYPTVRWEATLREPLGAFPQASRLFVVDVVGNIDLAGVAIELRVEPRDGTITRWYPAAWTATDGNRGTCTAHVTTPPRGHCTVVVRPRTGAQQPTLHAGRIVVQ